MGPAVPPPLRPPQPTVPGDRTPAPVPGLFIVDPASGDGTSAEPGTRCWYDTCIDYIGPVTNDEAVEFDAGASLGWQAEGGTIETISHAWVAAAGLNSEPGDGTLAWHMVDTIDFVEGDIAVPSEPGEYILVMFARYTSGDDVTWGLFVRAV